jgi:hypothetical protein
MRTSGMKLLDSILETAQIDWLIVPAEECRDVTTENHFIRAHFRRPHEPWGHLRAFVMPVCIRRSRRRVLFYQESGIEL